VETGGEEMRVGISAAIVAVSLLVVNAAWSACPPGQSRSVHPRAVQSHAGQSHAGQSGDCLDLNLVPQITQRLVADEHITTPPKTAPVAAPPAAYTGPTVGVSRTVRQAPTVGYRWSID
jgi:hypothetical protein